ncbi:hypothetical protein IJ670_07925 [bacterium]|nr:hypothetical protein [bacterium]
MNVALFTNPNAQNNVNQNVNDNTETAGSIAYLPKTNTGSVLFEKRDDKAVTPDATVETAGSIASAYGLNGQSQTQTAGNTLSFAA